MINIITVVSGNLEIRLSFTGKKNRLAFYDLFVFLIPYDKGGNIR